MPQGPGTDLTSWYPLLSQCPSFLPIRVLSHRPSWARRGPLPPSDSSEPALHPRPASQAQEQLKLAVEADGARGTHVKLSPKWDNSPQKTPGAYLPFSMGPQPTLEGQDIRKGACLALLPLGTGTFSSSTSDSHPHVGASGLLCVSPLAPCKAGPSAWEGGCPGRHGPCHACSVLQRLAAFTVLMMTVVSTTSR